MESIDEVRVLIQKALHHQEDLLHSARDESDIQHIQFDIAKLKCEQDHLNKSMKYWSESEIDRLRVLAGETSLQPLWMLEYGKDYSVPQPLQEMIDNHEVIDVSNENEACPHFIYRNFFSIWVEHPDVNKRKTDGKRYTVTTMDCMGTMLDVALETENLPELIDYLRKQNSVAV